jgi:hypothetical protein
MIRNTWSKRGMSLSSSSAASSLLTNATARRNKVAAFFVIFITFQKGFTECGGSVLGLLVWLDPAAL